MIKIVILGNSPSFNQSFFSSLSPKLTTKNKIFFRNEIIDYELICGRCSFNNSDSAFFEIVWALEALNAHGILFAHSNIQTDRLDFGNDFYQSLKEKFSKPAVLVVDNFSSDSMEFDRIIQVDPFEGENCKLALLAVIYLINKRLI